MQFKNGFISTAPSHEQRETCENLELRLLKKNQVWFRKEVLAILCSNCGVKSYKGNDQILGNMFSGCDISYWVHNTQYFNSSVHSE